MNAESQQLFTAIIEQDGDAYVVLCPDLDIASQGESVEGALANLREAVGLFLETADPKEILERTRGHVTHHEWLAEGAGDPRPALAARVIQACGGARTVAAYSAGFERGRLMEMADALPALAAPLHGIADRLVDLLPVVRNHVYHPDFGGSFSLKSVLPAMVPELSYDDLAISEGSVASQELERLLFREAELTPEAKAQLRSDLLRYCHQDTWGLVRLLRRFRELAAR